MPGQCNVRAPPPDWLALRPGTRGLQGLSGSAPIPQLARCAIPSCAIHRCPDLGHGAGSNPAGHPGSRILSSWPSCPAEVPMPATARALGCSEPWPQWAGGHSLAQPGPALPHQAHRQGVACHSSPLWQLNKTKLVRGAASSVLGWLPSPLPPSKGLTREVHSSRALSHHPLPRCWQLYRHRGDKVLG